MEINNISLNYYSFGFYGGLISEFNRSEPILGLDGLVRLSQKYGLAGVEIPFDHFYGLTEIERGLEDIKKIHTQGLSVFIDLENTDIKYISHLVPKLPSLGIKTIRIKMDQIGPTIYGGNRYLSDTFEAAVDQFKKKLIALMPVLEKFGVSVAIENHQDFHSLELLDIAKKMNPALVGITWDVGNSIAVGDTIESFYANAGHLIKNVHLKDYKLFKSSKGVRLVRCPLGEGVVDYRSLFEKLSSFEVNMSIELGAQITRECNINDSGYWDKLSDINLSKEDYLAFIENNAISDQQSLSKFEQGYSERELIKDELDDLEISVNNFKRILSEINSV